MAPDSTIFAFVPSKVSLFKVLKPLKTVADNRVFVKLLKYNIFNVENH